MERGGSMHARDWLMAHNTAILEKTTKKKKGEATARGVAAAANNAAAAAAAPRSTQQQGSASALSNGTTAAKQICRASSQPFLAKKLTAARGRVPSISTLTGGGGGGKRLVQSAVPASPRAWLTRFDCCSIRSRSSFVRREEALSLFPSRPHPLHLFYLRSCSCVCVPPPNQPASQPKEQILLLSLPPSRPMYVYCLRGPTDHLLACLLQICLAFPSRQLTSKTFDLQINSPSLYFFFWFASLTD